MAVEVLKLNGLHHILKVVEVQILAALLQPFLVFYFLLPLLYRGIVLLNIVTFECSPLVDDWNSNFILHFYRRVE